jgi:hypothetical protein
MSMIHPLIPRGWFDPEATKIMGDVFDEMIRSLEQFGRPRIIQDAIARHVIAVAGGGARDREVIWERVLAAMSSASRRQAEEVADRPS